MAKNLADLLTLTDEEPLSIRPRGGKRMQRRQTQNTYRSSVRGEQAMVRKAAKATRRSLKRWLATAFKHERWEEAEAYLDWLGTDTGQAWVRVEQERDEGQAGHTLPVWDDEDEQGGYTDWQHMDGMLIDDYRGWHPSGDDAA